jgi:hypothetical protein
MPRRLHSLPLFALAILTLGAAYSAIAHAQSGAVPKPGSSTAASVLGDSGTYLYTLIPEESDDVRAAIDRAVSHMLFIIRPIARHRLARTNRVPPHLTFAVRPDTITVTFEHANPIPTPRNGTPVPWVSGVSRETYTVHIAFAGDTLHQEILASDGAREDDFVFSDSGGRIIMHVTLRADRLPTPLVYTLVFRRESVPEAQPATANRR